jgi:hypothetical protein
MAEKRRFYDLWIIEANTVYREVPFDAVADWVQQGRLLEDDMLRPSGTAEWRRLGDFMDFKVYLPKPAAAPEPPSAVEPMEPVEMGFTWRRRPENEDAEVDMIPLIDVSLVLLIFFMLTTKEISSGGPPIATPGIENGFVANATIDSVWLGMDMGKDGKPVYSCGVGGAPPADGDSNLSSQDVLDHLNALLTNGYGLGRMSLEQTRAPEFLAALRENLKDRKHIDLTFYGNPHLSYSDVYPLRAQLAKEPFHTEIGATYDAGSDKKP